MCVRVCVCVMMSVQLTASKFVTKCQKATHLLECLRTQVHSRKDKNIDILSLSQEVSTVFVYGEAPVN